MILKKDKFLHKNDFENVIVKIIFTAISKNKKEKYQCVGVLVRDDKEVVRIGFNAINDNVKDYLDIKKVDVLDIIKVKPSEIKLLH